jgi:hypothetical protein
MEQDERLETLCREFSTLAEDEKDYILGVSHALSSAMSIQPKLPESASDGKSVDQSSTPK